MSTLPTGYRVSQGFGVSPDAYRRFGLLGHNGVDYAVPCGTPVVAPDAGSVELVDHDPSGYGRYIRIQRQDGGVWLLAHLSQVMVGPGQQVREGQVVALSGGAADDPYRGFSTGCHLHVGWMPPNPNMGNGYGGFEDPASAPPLSTGGGQITVMVDRRPRLWAALLGGAAAWVLLGSPLPALIAGAALYLLTPDTWGWLPVSNGGGPSSGPSPSGRFSALAPFWQLIKEAAARYSLDPALLGALVYYESGGNPDAVSPAGAVGLGQVMPRERGFPDRPTADELRDPATNLEWSARILAGNIARWGGVEAGLERYLGVGVDPYTGVSTSQYAAAILSLQGELQGALA